MKQTDKICPFKNKSCIAGACAIFVPFASNLDSMDEGTCAIRKIALNIGGL